MKLNKTFIAVAALVIIAVITFTAKHQIEQQALQAELEQALQAELKINAALEQARRHLANLEDPTAGFIFTSEEQRMRGVLQKAGLNLSNLDLTEADVENLRLASYAGTTSAYINMIRAQPLYAVTYIGKSTLSYIAYTGRSLESYGLDTEQFSALRECGFEILANRVAEFEAGVDGRTYNPLISTYKQLADYVVNRDLSTLSRDATIKLMDLVGYGLTTDPPCAPYLN